MRRDAELLTIEELAQLLRVPKGWIYSRTRDRSLDAIPHLKLGKYLRFEEEKVQAWLDSRRKGWKNG
jgi:excisionase family DNA binding protein